MSAQQLSADLRERSDTELAAFLQARPDLLVPLPPNLDSLAARSLSRWSVSAALTGMDLWCGELAQALVAIGWPTSADAVAAALRADPAAVAGGLGRLRDLGLVWGSAEALSAAPPLTAMLSPVLATPHPDPPELSTTEIGIASCDRAGGDAAATVTRLVEELLEAWGAAAPGVLKTGGLGLRELRRSAVALDVPEGTAALLVEIAFAAGLVAGTVGYDAEWLPTPAFDAWQAAPVAQRWTALAGAWLQTPRAPGRALSRDERGKTRTALSTELLEPREPDQRRALLAVLAGLPAGWAAGATAVAEVVHWHRPLAFDPALGGDAVTQAELLGVTGRGGLTTAGRLIVAGDPGAAAAALAPYLPSLLDQVVLQADLTAVAPGPLDPPLARELRLLAEVESTGGATVYRFSDASLRRAFDAGRTAGDVQAWLERSSRTPVPQALRYLVDDVARRHGRIRVGSAEAFVRCDDETLLGEVLASRRTAALRLRRLAPTVLAAGAPAGTVMDTLRAAGFAPARESPSGEVVLERAARRRTPSPKRPPPRAGGRSPTPQQVEAAVRALRAGERASRQRRAAPGSAPAVTEPMATLRLMQQAARDGRAVWIDYLNSSGVASQRIIEPSFVNGGQVVAYDHRRGERRTFAAHRIASAAPVGEDELFLDGLSEDEE